MELPLLLPHEITTLQMLVNGVWPTQLQERLIENEQYINIVHLTLHVQHSTQKGQLDS